MIDALASFSVILLAAAEIASPSSLRLASILSASSIVLLLVLSGHRRSYLIMSILLSLCIGGFAAVQKLMKHRPTTPQHSSRRITSIADVLSIIRFHSFSEFWESLQQFILWLLPRGLASMHHLLGLWILPFCSLYGAMDARSDPDYFSQEIGHLVPASFYVVGLVIIPLLILPRGYETASTVHQLGESIFNVGFSTVYFIIFRTAHHLEGQDPPRLGAPNWDHEFLGVIFCGAGLVGMLLAMQNIRTSIHITFPTAFVAYTMVSHSNSHHMTMDMETMASEDLWKLTWMKLHFIHGMLFGIGALCRLLDKVPESIFFFYLGAFCFVTSAQWVVRAMVVAIDYEDDPESAGRNYPTDHVVPLLVITSGTALYALFLGSAIQLRKFFDTESAADGMGEYEALSLPPTTTHHDTDEESAEDDEKLHCELIANHPEEGNSRTAK